MNRRNCMTISSFVCERCHDNRAVSSGPHGFLEYAILPLFFIWHCQCTYCEDRFATFGIGKYRIVFPRKTSEIARTIGVVLLWAGALAGVLLYFLLYR